MWLTSASRRVQGGCYAQTWMPWRAAPSAPPPSAGYPYPCMLLGFTLGFAQTSEKYDAISDT